MRMIFTEHWIKTALTEAKEKGFVKFKNEPGDEIGVLVYSKETDTYYLVVG